MAKTAIVITRIHPPNEAIASYARTAGHQLIVVGDKKTPRDWACEGVEFISIEEQTSVGFRLSDTLPYNHYCRKMPGYLRAVEMGAECIIDTDDDNYPRPNWGFSQ